MTRPHKRRVSAKGRNAGGFVKLDHGLLDSEAWADLTPHAQALYVAIARRYNGRNNGNIGYSIRDARDYLGCGSDKARACFNELVEKGLIVCRRKSSFTLKTKAAREWALTAEREGDNPPTRTFKEWPMKKKSRYLSAHPTVPEAGTVDQKPAATVPGTGTVPGDSSALTVLEAGTHIICHMGGSATSTPNPEISSSKSDRPSVQTHGSD